MNKLDLAKQFAARLRDAMIATGFNSNRSTSGVDIHKLAEITGYSPQICRKYLRGQAIPEPIKLAEIATKLSVSPGWLLFGDCVDDDGHIKKNITMSKNLLQYMFTHAGDLYNAERSNEDIADFLLDLARDISQINATEEQSKKIIDLALFSAQHF